MTQAPSASEVPNSSTELSPENREAWENLVELARRGAGHIPASVLASQVQEVTRGGDWPLQRTALEALLRRWAFARRDGLMVASRPAGQQVLGEYSTRRRRVAGKENKPGSRPYRTTLECLEPPRVSCDCPDFLKGSLGMCKHVLVVLDDLYAKPRRVARALAQQTKTSALSGLRWDPVRPLTGLGDPLARLYWGPPQGPGALESGVVVKRAMQPGSLSSHRKRLSAVLELLQAMPAKARKKNPPFEPAVHALLLEEKARLERTLKGKELRPKVLTHLRKLKRKLYAYQKEGVVRFLETGRLLLADDMGLGKTIQAVAICHCLFHSKRVRRGVLIVPAALKPQWLREWQACTDVPAMLVEGSPAERQRQYSEFKSGFLIMGYEQLLRDLPQVVALEPELIALDEAQRIKNWQTKSAASVKQLTPEFRLVLTGTPMENRLEELASLLDWVDDSALAPQWRLSTWHSVHGSDGERANLGARHLSTLRSRVEHCLVRRTRQEVLDQLPHRTDTRVPVAMTEEQQEEHDELRKPIRALMNVSKRRPLTQKEFLRLMQLFAAQRMICNGLGQVNFNSIWPGIREQTPNDALLAGLFSPKLVELRRLLTDLVVRQGRKVVIFSQWRKMLRLSEWATRDILAEVGGRAVFFSGAESSRLRTQNIIELHDDPNTRVMFLTDAGGVGLNLQRAASACINLELPWNPAVLEQRIGRIHRIGQERAIDAYNLVSEYGIEAHVATLVASKRALFEGLFDGTSDEVQFQEGGSFMEGVSRLLAAEESSDSPEESDSDLDLEFQQEPVLDSVEKPLAASDSPGGQLPSSSAVEALLGSLRVERKPSGALSIEAPPEVAPIMISALENMVRLLRGPGAK